MSSNAESRTLLWKVSHNLSQNIYPFIIGCQAIGGINPFFFILGSEISTWHMKHKPLMEFLLSLNSFDIFNLFIWFCCIVDAHFQVSAHIQYNYLFWGKGLKVNGQLLSKLIHKIDVGSQLWWWIIHLHRHGTRDQECNVIFFTRTWFRNGRNFQALTQLLNHLNVLQGNCYYSNVMDSCYSMSPMCKIGTESHRFLVRIRVINWISITNEVVVIFLFPITSCLRSE